jgi:acetoin utilization deacetylase AcuC-like enzyme
MSLRLYSHPTCLLHSNGEGHAESPQRLAVVLEALHQAKLPGVDWQEAPLATRTQLRRVHADALLEQVLDVATPTAPPARSGHRDERAFGQGRAACRGRGLRRGGRGDAGVRDARLLCSSPAGHHATPTQAMGFCLFNSIAVGAAHALAAHGLARVAVVDFDVHHGNGTQDIFWNEPRVLFASSHQRGIYPGTGAADERGRGNILNAPLPAGSGGILFRRAWGERLLPEIDAFKPQLIFVSAGFDAHRLDPLAGLMLEADDYAWITTELVALAERHCQGRLVSSLEGGYHLDALRESALAHVRALLGGA